MSRFRLPRAVGVLMPVAKSGAYTAAPGDLVVATGSFTVTLPAPTPGRVVGVKSVNGTGAAPVTVTAASGAILGLGIGGASSMLLGSAGSFVTLQADGTNWHVIAGGQDTGWISLTPYMQAGWSNYGGVFQTCEFRKGPQGMVALRGLIQYTTIGSYSTFNAGSLPLGFRPAAQTIFQTQGNGTTWSVSPFRTDIRADGLIESTAAAGGNNWTGAWLSFEGISFQAA